MGSSFIHELRLVLGQSSPEFQRALKPQKTHANNSSVNKKYQKSSFIHELRLVLGQSSPEFQRSRYREIAGKFPWQPSSALELLRTFVIGDVVLVFLGIVMTVVAMTRISFMPQIGREISIGFFSGVLLMLLLSVRDLFGFGRLRRSDLGLYSSQRLDPVGVSLKQTEFKAQIKQLEKELASMHTKAEPHTFKDTIWRNKSGSRYILKSYGSNIILLESTDTDILTMYGKGTIRHESLSFDYFAIDGSQGNAYLKIDNDTLEGEFYNETYKQSSQAFLRLDDPSMA